MILERTNENINKAESSRMMDAQIGFADALQRVPSDDGGRYLEFRGWIRHDPRCNGTSVTFELSQLLALGNGFIEAMRSALMC